jgi:cytoskeleton protein RodZ
VTDTVAETVETEAPPGPGAALRLAREARGLAIEDIADALKLTPKQVAAMESEDFQQLPGATFARGFVRNYARLMQVDAAALLAAVERAFTKRDVELAPLATAIGTMPSASGARSVPRWLLIAFAVVAVALLLVVYAERFQGGSWTPWRSAPTEETAAPAAGSGAPGTETLSVTVTPLAAPPAPGGTAATPPQESAPAVLPKSAAEASAEEAPGSGSDAAAAAPSSSSAASESRKLAFAFTLDSWVEVKDGSGKMLVAKVNRAGSTLEVEGRPPFAIVVGNARGVQLTDQGKAVDLKAHISGTIARFNLE